MQSGIFISCSDTRRLLPLDTLIKSWRERERESTPWNDHMNNAEGGREGRDHNAGEGRTGSAANSSGDGSLA